MSDREQAEAILQKALASVEQMGFRITPRERLVRGDRVEYSDLMLEERVE